jgi:hypothetical protein
MSETELEWHFGQVMCTPQRLKGQDRPTATAWKRISGVADYSNEMIAFSVSEVPKVMGARESPQRGFMASEIGTRPRLEAHGIPPLFQLPSSLDGLLVRSS